MIAACRRANVLFALHDNYIDIYPDAEGFSYEENIAFQGNGHPCEAGSTKGAKPSRTATAPTRGEPFLQPNLQSRRTAPADRLLHRRLVERSAVRLLDCRWAVLRLRRRPGRVGPALRLDPRPAGQPAPQISESGHDQLIGWLDGAQTNHLRVGHARARRSQLVRVGHPL